MGWKKLFFFQKIIKINKNKYNHDLIEYLSYTQNNSEVIWANISGD